MRKKRHLVANVLISPVENQIEDREGYDLIARHDRVVEFRASDRRPNSFINMDPGRVARAVHRCVCVIAHADER